MPPDPLQTIQAYTSAWNRHDAEAIVATFAEGGTYTDPATGGPLTGPAIGAYAASLWVGFPDLAFETISVLEKGDGFIAFEWLMTGTNTGAMNGLPPTGKSVSVPGADFVRVEGGKIVSLQGYFDSGAVPRSLGLDVIVQPRQIGPFVFGTSVRVSNGSTAMPAAYSITSIEPRNDQEKLVISETSRKIGMEMLSFPGFISLIAVTVGDRMLTITAWESADAMAPLMKTGEHRDIVHRYFASELGRGGATGVWVPGRLNPRRIRCETCSKMAPVVNEGDMCSCGSPLPAPLAYW